MQENKFAVAEFRAKLRQSARRIFMDRTKFKQSRAKMFTDRARFYTARAKKQDSCGDSRAEEYSRAGHREMSRKDSEVSREDSEASRDTEQSRAKF